MLALRIEMGTCDDFEGGIGRPSLLNHLSRFKRIGDRDDKLASLTQIRGVEDLRLCRISNDCLDPASRSANTVLSASSITRKGLPAVCSDWATSVSRRK